MNWIFICHANCERFNAGNCFCVFPGILSDWTKTIRDFFLLETRPSSFSFWWLAILEQITGQNNSRSSWILNNKLPKCFQNILTIASTWTFCFSIQYQDCLDPTQISNTIPIWSKRWWLWNCPTLSSKPFSLTSFSSTATRRWSWRKRRHWPTLMFSTEFSSTAASTDLLPRFLFKIFQAS